MARVWSVEGNTDVFPRVGVSVMARVSVKELSSFIGLTASIDCRGNPTLRQNRTPLTLKTESQSLSG